VAEGAGLKAQRKNMGQIVIFCMYRVERIAQRAKGIAHGVICPGGIWTCTNPNGHCSCVSTCGIKLKEKDEQKNIQGISCMLQPQMFAA
jgi:hypothetical protein